MSVLAQNKSIPNFGEAKSVLRNIYGNKNKTFYCNCAYQKKSIKSGCNLNSKKRRKRDSRLEWEHVVPASRFGKTFVEWKQSKKICPPRQKKNGKLKKISSRKCATKKNKDFRYMAADLINLVPVVGTVNAWRSAKKIKGLGKAKPICSTGAKQSKKFFSPPASKRGDVARIYQYMFENYPRNLILNVEEKEMFTVWAKKDPVDSMECEIYFKKSKKQKIKSNIWEAQCKK